MTAEVIKSSSQLYDRDYNLWLESTIGQLRDRQFESIDLLNLIEELEGMSRSEKRAVYRNLKIMLMHLLKYRYQPTKRSHSWRSSIREHRQRLKKAFEESPSLKNYFNNNLPDGYQDARELAADETGLALEAFPINCPFFQEQILDTEYLPE